MPQPSSPLDDKLPFTYVITLKAHCNLYYALYCLTLNTNCWRFKLVTVCLLQDYIGYL